MNSAAVKALWAQIRDSYVQTKSIRKTAKELGLSKSGVEYALKGMGVDRFPRNRSGNENSSRKALLANPSGPRAVARDPAFMRDLYIDKNMSIPEIAKTLGLSETTVHTCLHQCGVDVRTRADGLRGRPRPGQQGSKHRDWKGGVTSWRKRARGRLNPAFVRPVMERDGFKCQWCGGTRALVVHHIRSFAHIARAAIDQAVEKDEESIVKAIVLAHRLEDGVTLCKTCHDEYHKIHGK